MTLPGAHKKLGLILAAIILVADQAIKYYVKGPLGLTIPGQSIDLLPFFDLTYTENRGVSLGLLTAESDAMRWGLVALTAAIAIGVLFWLTKERSKGDTVGLGLVLGGAIGNIIDRSRLGYVIDYADLHFGEFRPFLIFNVADAAITIGVLILLVRAFLVREPKQVSETDPEMTNA